MGWESITIQAGDVRLEGELRSGPDGGAGVVCHPHPLYGGSMQNNVVHAAAQGLALARFSSLRFNFRGVGRSTGSYGQGREERNDVTAAAGYLADQGRSPIVVIGYSFGAHVAAFAWPQLREIGVRPLILIAPPAAFMNFGDLPAETDIGLMICGERDDIGPCDLAAEVGERLDRPVEPEVISGADHFFGGREDRLARLIADHLAGL